MGRPKKYATTEEANEAKREQCREAMRRRRAALRDVQDKFTTLQRNLIKYLNENPLDPTIIDDLRICLEELGININS